MDITWRGVFTSDEVNLLHAEAFGTRLFDVSEWDWRRLVADHSLGWVTARDVTARDVTARDVTARDVTARDVTARDVTARNVTVGDTGRLVGFVNVVWDGLVHAWLQDVMVAADARHLGIGRQIVAAARDGARAAGCEWLHVDFDDDLASFYLDACGFRPTQAGLLQL
ncbi:Acetyltransferase (GNAT) family protein [Modestobacter sp. DSM 44400]|uniref:GNAT family N-acetyltransferase n=1 Tax=Modestobacter sp. DSM 44400 TaxID=1550230 RepID=UPI00089AC9A3|nr:GNAT family N-acetyltransferase [Modestobacter sp. DSM 44400]SDY01494.1 Acetyltransferase (GNAT) family protein [Modestobacter sp. DSM 44400]